MTYSIKPATLSVALLSVLALSGCPEQQKTDTLAAAASTAAPAAVNALTLDESKLTPAIRFSPSDLDASKSACGDFGGYGGARGVTTGSARHPPSPCPR